MNRQEKIIFAILIIVIVSLIVYLSFIYFRQKHYETGFIEGRQTVYNQIISDLQSYGYTTVFITRNNETINIRLGQLPS